MHLNPRNHQEHLILSQVSHAYASATKNLNHSFKKNLNSKSCYYSCPIKYCNGTKSFYRDSCDNILCLQKILCQKLCYSVCLIFTCIFSFKCSPISCTSKLMIKQYQTKTDCLFWHGMKICSTLLTVPHTKCQTFFSCK